MVREVMGGLSISYPDPPSVAGMSEASDLVFTGTVVRVDGQSTYVEPDDLLKGTPLFGAPIAFRCAIGVGTHRLSLSEVLAEGDELLVFATCREQATDGPDSGATYSAFVDSVFMRVGEDYLNLYNNPWTGTITPAAVAAFTGGHTELTGEGQDGESSLEWLGR